MNLKNEDTSVGQYKVLVIPSDRTGVSFFRSTKPHITLEENHPEFKVDIVYAQDINYSDPDYFNGYDLLHYHKTVIDYEKMGDFINTLRGKGIVTVMDIDDHWSPGPHHPAHHIIKSNNLDEKLKGNLKHPDYVMTTTEIFAKEISKYNKNVIVVPNAIDPNERQFKPNPEKSDRVRIGWLGGSSHLYDLQNLRGVVNKIKSAGLIDKVQFVLCGFDIRGKVREQTPDGKIIERAIRPEETVWSKYEEIFTDNYSIISEEYKNFLLKYDKSEFKGIENEPYRRVWTKPVTTYATNYNLFDISLAPLEENNFNKVKSQLKLIEAGFHKKAVICQNFGPYTIDTKDAYLKGGDINKDGNVLLVDSNKNHKLWFKYIKELVENEDLRKQLSENLHNTVKETYSLQNTAKMRADFYKKILKKD